MSAPAEGRPTARLLLAAIILAITCSPRIRLPGLLDRAVDLRVQDFLLLIGLAYVGTRLPTMRPVWGPRGALFAAGSIAVTTLHLWMEPTTPALRSVAYLGRALEAFLLAAVIAGLYRLAGDRARRSTLGAFHAAIAINVLWVGYQYATGAQRTLLGRGVGDLIESYGPKLVGEASAFGTGFFFVLAAALGAAELLTRVTPRWIGGGILAAGMAGAYLSQSRVSLGAAALCAVAVVLLRSANGKRNVFGALVISAAAIVVVPRLPAVGRLSEAGVGNGLNVRVSTIWGPLLRVFDEHLWLGIGPGQLGTQAYPWTEAHNIALRAGLDYGVVVGLVFLAAYLTVAVRACRTAAVTSDQTTRLWALLTALVIGGALLAGIAQDALTAVMSTHLVMLAAGLLGGALHGPYPDRQKPPTWAERQADLVRQHTTETRFLAAR